MKKHDKESTKEACQTAEASEQVAEEVAVGADDKRAEKKAEKALEDAQKALEALQKEKDELNDTYLRMLAEYDNFRKRATREKDAMYAEGICDAVEKLLPVIDNLERAASIDPSSDASSVIEGVKKVLEMANECFTGVGVKEIPAQGETFNPELHNAVMHEDNEDYAENVVAEVFQKGYMRDDKVIRHAVVKVMN